MDQNDKRRHNKPVICKNELLLYIGFRIYDLDHLYHDEKPNNAIDDAEYKGRISELQHLITWIKTQ